MKDDVKFQQLPRKSRPQPGKTLARRRFRLGGIEVIAAGPPDGGTPILFVHGAFAGAWMWDEVFLPYFAVLIANAVRPRALNVSTERPPVAPNRHLGG